MKFLLLLSLVFASSVLAEDALAPGGRSPDGRREVRVARAWDREPSDYRIEIRAMNRVAPLLILDDVGGWLRYPGAKKQCCALWHTSANFVVIMDRGAKTSSKVFVIDLSGPSAKRLSLPDYVQNALGRVNATSTSTTCFSVPKAWYGDDLLVTLHFWTDSLKFGRQRYCADVVLRLFHGRYAEPNLQLVAVSAPVEDG